jgi:hypothetical protein
MTFQKCFRRISKVEKSHRFGNVLGLSVVTVFLALSGAEAEQNATPGREKTIPVCRDGHPLLLPLIPHLNTQSWGVVVKEEDDDQDAKSLWQSGDPPIQLNGFVFSAHSSGPNRIPLLDALLGRKSPYSIGRFSIGTPDVGRFESWPGQHPLYKILPSGTLLFIPPDLTLFGQPLTLRCHEGIPVYSNDENSHVCLASGIGPDGMAIGFMFNTGNDLEGHWPVTKNDWVSQNWTGMSKPLAEIERLVEFMRVSGNEKFKCN